MSRTVLKKKNLFLFFFVLVLLLTSCENCSKGIRMFSDGGLEKDAATITVTKQSSACENFPSNETTELKMLVLLLQKQILPSKTTVGFHSFAVTVFFANLAYLLASFLVFGRKFSHSKENQIRKSIIQYIHNQDDQK